MTNVILETETNETSEEISNEIVDNIGRVFKLKEITGKTRVAFFRALGAEDASNKSITSEYWNVMAVDEIDGKKQGTIKGLIDIEFIANSLEKSNAGTLVIEWLVKKVEEKERAEREGSKSLKK